MDLRKFATNAYKKGSGSPPNPPDDKAPGLVKEGSPSKSQPLKSPEKTPPKTLVKPRVNPSYSIFTQDGGKGPTKIEIAKYLLAIGKEQASEIIKHLPEEAVEALVQEIAQIRILKPDEKQEILLKFESLMATAPTRSTGGVDTARGFLVQAFGPEKGEEFLRRALPDKVFKHFGFMEDYEAAQIHTLLKNEGPALRALVLSHLSPPKSAGVIKLMPKEEQMELIRRLSKMEKLDRDVLISVEEALKERIRKIGTVHAEEVDGKGILAEILKNMDAKNERTLLEFLQEDDPALSVDIKERLFTIDTLLAIEDRDLQKILPEVENGKLALVMKGKSEEIRRKILTNISQARSQIVVEEYQYMGPKRRSEIDEATREFVRYLKKLEEEGKLVVRRENEEYI